MKKKEYIKPVVETEIILERVALACSKASTDTCDTFVAPLNAS